MLSRVAESVHWMARYVERAEDMTRVLAVRSLAALDAPPGFQEQALSGLLDYLGEAEAFHGSFARADVPSLCEFFVCHAGNPASVVSSIRRARENARAVREQASSEMWEHLNRLYFEVNGVRAEQLASGPYEFYRRIRDGSQAFQGITDATLTRGEAYWFIEAGRLLERASQTLRVLGVAFAGRAAGPLPDSTLELITLLKSCSAFEPFRQARGGLTGRAVAEFLLQQQRFPRAALFCVAGAAGALDRVTELAAPGSLRPDRPRLLLGRLSAELQYLELDDVLGAPMAGFLDGLLRRVHEVADEVARSYFSNRAVLPAGRGLQDAPQEQQQQ